jgi:hypothetical protein
LSFGALFHFGFVFHAAKSAAFLFGRLARVSLDLCRFVTISMLEALEPIGASFAFCRKNKSHAISLKVLRFFVRYIAPLFFRFVLSRLLFILIVFIQPLRFEDIEKRKRDFILILVVLRFRSQILFTLLSFHCLSMAFLRFIFAILPI